MSDQIDPLLDLTCSAVAGPSATTDTAVAGEASERLRIAFDEARREHSIDGSLAAVDDDLEVRFADQEGAEGSRILEAFIEELARFGVRGASRLRVGGLDGLQIERAERAVRLAVARLRTLLVEFHSYLSGGLPWVFAGGHATLRERGLAIYRYRKTDAVDVSARGDAIRIAFAAGPLSEPTSSGFYVPTLVDGDFCVTLDYRLGPWDSQGNTASFALFAQDQASFVRYYAQRRSSQSDDHHVLASMCGQLSDPHPIVTDTGSFRIERRDGTVVSSHRNGNADWIELGRQPQPDPREMIIGAKLWCADRCRGLVLDFSNLRIDGEIPEAQIPPVPVRPDPRLTPSG